jgi:Na+-transporting methylmalonyl-CoA/oxaloacetate decarboxylase gamma subunit
MFGEYFFFVLIMVMVLMGAFLAVSLSPLWANAEFWRERAAKKQAKDAAKDETHD